MIYFIGNKQEKIVKIGYTVSKINQRVSVIQANCPFIVECFLLIEGLKDTEQYLHNMFKAEYIRGEWFKYEGKVEDYINNPIKLPIIETFKHTPRKDAISKDNMEIEKLYSYGLSCLKIAQRLGYTESQIRTFIERRNFHKIYKYTRKKKPYISNHQRTPKTIHLPEVKQLV